ncbi:class I SAM-dependent methyltransferase [Antrihabitans sp. YC3-6]|uniref:Class I SAM-dependent methyltransferase n=1 Tax=Antrihabitans stalagmiti TaxID=2799499 RepID=A0A934NWW5_9NOCA|nr:class I SAM-dependent methyltransferase [Antrihabitans stalagmiti]MBJ8342891.1 class I SAM-dependent methyltransferase [Antrihabitans stalagmiti]
MFDLAEKDVRGRILDCPGGAASFTAQACELGADVVAVDPVYATPAAEVAEHSLAEAGRSSAWTTASAARYVWDFYGDVAGHHDSRRAAAQRFATDLVAHPLRYTAASLPALPFADNTFDLVLSSHLLFTYVDRLDFAFHVAALTELARVSAGEVRVYPLVDHAGGRLDDLVAGLRTELSRNGIASVIRSVEFEFQRGSNTMLVLE